MSLTNRNIQLQSAVRVALAAGALATASAAYAQSAPKVAAPALEEVVITGSRLSTSNDLSISPVISVSAADIQQKGITRIEDMLSSMPQIYASQNSAVSNGSDGTATVSLRNLGSNRTLVLVNGRRLGPGDPGGSAADLNQIPAELVERVEVLTGGASSVYGADAVAGVVNFVLDNHFEGFKVTSNYGFYEHSQHNPNGVQGVLSDFNSTYDQNFAAAPSNVHTGFTKDLSVMFGFNTGDGKGNVTTYATYRNVAAVLQSQYDYSAASLGSGYCCSSNYDGRFTVSGSSTSYPGRFRLVSQYGVNIGDSKVLIPNADNTGLSSWGSGNAYRFNYGPLNYQQRPDERYTAGAFAHYEFNEHADVYTEIQYINDHTLAQIAPSGAFYGSGPYQVSCANPLLTTAELGEWCGGSNTDTDPRYLLIGRRNVEGGNRIDDLTHSAWRFVQGSKGKISDAWDYDVYYSNSITILSESYLNDLSISRMKNALNVVTDTRAGSPTFGQPVCASVVSGTDPNCVPYNIWQPGGVTPAALKYIQTPLISNGRTTQQMISGNVTGDLGQYGIKLPSAASGMRINIGAEWREVTSDFEPDFTYISGDAAGSGSPTLPVKGSIISRELFAETRLPLLDDKPFAKTMALEAGYRYSDYSLGFKTNSYKLGLEWSPIQELRVRGSFAHAVRAPNISELYQPVHVGLDGSSDPCSGNAPSYSQQQCAALGLSSGLYGLVDPNPASQYNGYFGGNPNLKPETAKTVSFGVGYSPTFLPGFRMQVDYYDINITDTISSVGPSTIMALCANKGLQQFCDLVHRDVNGSLWISNNGYVSDPLSNNGALREKGIDFDVSYNLDMGAYGKMHTSFVATKVNSYQILPLQSRPDTAFDCNGFYGNSCGSPNFKWRHTLTSTWMTPWRGADVSLAWRYFGAVTVDGLSSNPNISVDGTTNPAACEYFPGFSCISTTDAHLSSRSYIDLSGSMKVADHVTVRLGINNILDKDPPIVGANNIASGNGNTFPSQYDALGRYVFGSVTVQF